MPYCRIQPGRSVRGTITLPGDKSIAHRSIIISAIAKGKTKIYNFPTSQDCQQTLKAFKKLGVKISEIKTSKAGKAHAYIDLCVEGKGLSGLRQPAREISLGESGTTARLLLGVLAGQAFWTRLTADRSLERRPMKRVTLPLRKMGALIKAQKKRGNEYFPVRIKGGKLRSIRYKLPVASAQVKSALLLAGLYARGTTRVLEPIKTRDHTEAMLRDFGAAISIKDKLISIRGGRELISPGKIYIPGDISSASFFIIAATLLPDSRLKIKSVSLNSSRIGLIRVLKRMGANIKVAGSRRFAGGPRGDIIIKSSRLKGTQVKRNEIPQLIDELPILILAACFAKGKTVINAAEELRVKETDRINSMQNNLSKMGAKICVTSYRGQSGKVREKMVIFPVGQLRGCRVRSFTDHRTAMSLIIAGLVSSGLTLIDDLGCIAKSFPDFLKILRSVSR